MGIAEPIRFIFHYVNVDFEDNRLDHTDWPSQKDNYPWGVLPLLEEDGRQLSQSFTIGRYLGKKFKLNGADDYESAKCDEYGDALKDLLNECRNLFFETDETKKTELREEILSKQIPKYCGKFDRDLVNSESKYLVGTTPAWIDFFVAHYLEFLETKIDEKFLKNYPKLQFFKQNIYNLPQIKSWIETRPVTPW